ncbi:MAG TPA: glutamine-hydrolyzing carbamoyl-phosphate synthase small subunit [Longimicrobiales bacterium]|nr:glutamine-hydrolyzing carbamoyl-phosphate synthase small subunit [Longimicrobiales bacterium]
MAEPGYLILEDGRRFDGVCMGASGSALGEAVFNTSMTGYQEVLTDPSYAGQIVAMTAPMIGNYGVTDDDEESARPQVAGFVVRELSRVHTGWRASGSLSAYLERNGVVGLTEVDTRALTRHLRTAGAMRAAIVAATVSEEDALERVRAHPAMEGLNLTGEVSTPAPFEVEADGEARFRVVAYDFGVKSNSLRLLAERGCHVTTVPASTTLEELERLRPDGLFVSNGPGDPSAVGHALEAIHTLAEDGLPVFGICLGHQLLARAFGGETFKLLYGHRGGNHPVKRLEDGVVEITAQNHGFAVRADEEGGVAGAPELRVTHLNLNDGTVEGVAHARLPVFSVQYHPESAPGPHDSRYLFDRFVAAMAEREKKA